MPAFTTSTNSGCEGLGVSFFDATINNPNTFFWEFGDGATSILQNPTHIFDSAGVYDITLTTSILGPCSTSVTFPAEIKVFAKPVISFTADTIGCSLPFNVAFTDNTINADSWNWDFGDGNFATIQNPVNSYITQGHFDISLLVSNDSGCISSLTIPSYIKIDETPILDIDASPLVSCAGEDINFSNLYTMVSANFIWDFGGMHKFPAFLYFFAAAPSAPRNPDFFAAAPSAPGKC